MSQESSTRGTPKAEVKIDAALVLALLEEQHPDLSHLSIKFVNAGWDNVIYRLGDRLCIRLPRREAAAKLIEHEQKWLPQIAASLTIPVPTPYRLGKPTANYPWRWSILPWLAGVTAERELPDISQAKLLGSFWRSLHQPAPSNAPSNPVRGVPLKQRAVAIERRIQRLKSKTVLFPQIEKIWHRALNTPIDVSARWLHGDLHPGNVLVEKGEIVGIIDWGDITSGDIATDLAAIWMLFDDPNARRQAIAEYGNISQEILLRAKGWAIYFGVTLLDIGLVNNPRQAIIGTRTLRCVAEDEFV